MALLSSAILISLYRWDGKECISRTSLDGLGGGMTMEGRLAGIEVSGWGRFANRPYGKKRSGRRGTVGSDLGQGFGVLNVAYGFPDQSLGIVGGFAEADIEAFSVQSALAFVVAGFERTRCRF